MVVAEVGALVKREACALGADGIGFFDCGFGVVYNSDGDPGVRMVSVSNRFQEPKSGQNLN